MRHVLALLHFALLICSPLALCAGELRVESDKENVVASRLAGSWLSNQELSKRLTGNPLPKVRALVFESDPAIAEMVPEKYVAIFQERKMPIYMAGTMHMLNMELPFVLTQVHGNPHIMFWLERDGDRFGNGESFNVALTPAKDEVNDLLFIGGDFNNQPFSAFERGKE